MDLTKKIETMRKILFKETSYTISRMDVSELRELATFVVMQNYKHHQENSAKDVFAEIEAVYQEELQQIATSTIYVVRDLNDEMIGSIRVFEWNKLMELPIQRIFGISPLLAIIAEPHSKFWHVGRFAVNSRKGISTLLLFKQLMMLAIDPIIRSGDSYMIAESDSKLLRVMNLLGIETHQLGPSVEYLASETIPIYASKKGLLPFYEKHLHLLLN